MLSAAVVSENHDPPCSPLGGKYGKYCVYDTVFFAGVTSTRSFALMWQFRSFFITLPSVAAPFIFKVSKKNRPFSILMKTISPALGSKILRAKTLKNP